MNNIENQENVNGHYKRDNHSQNTDIVLDDLVENVRVFDTGRTLLRASNQCYVLDWINHRDKNFFLFNFNDDAYNTELHIRGTGLPRVSKKKAKSFIEVSSRISFGNFLKI